MMYSDDICEKYWQICEKYFAVFLRYKKLTINRMASL